MQLFFFITALALIVAMSQAFSVLSSFTPDEIIHQYNFSGSVSVFQPGKPLFHKNYGFLDTRFQIPFPASDPSYPIASNTKLYTAISLYQLQERKLVNLSDDIANYITPQDMVNFGQSPNAKFCLSFLSESETTCEKVTFVQLLAMSSGIDDPLSELYFPYPGSIGLCVGRYLQNPLRFKPGQQFYYSNAGFIFAGYFVEKFSGMKLEDYLSKNIFEPLGLLTTDSSSSSSSSSPNIYFDPFNGKFDLNENRVVEYFQFINGENKSEVLGVGQCNSEMDLGSINAAGGLVGTQSVERKIYYAMFNFSSERGGKSINPLLSPESTLELVQPRTVIKEGVYYFGQGLFLMAGDDHEGAKEKLLSASTPSYLPPTSPVQVTRIVYEGEIVCSHTSNVFDMTFSPPVMAQVWSHVIVFYPPSKKVWEEAVKQNSKITNGGTASFGDIVSGWKSQLLLQNISIELIKNYF